MEHIGAGAQVRMTILGLLLASGASIALLVTAIPNVPGADIAGQGTFRGVSPSSGQCIYVSAASRQYSASQVVNPTWGSYTFYTETDQFRYVYYSGSFQGGSCSGSILSSYLVAGAAYPITPAMVMALCGGVVITTCNKYPKNIISSYLSTYPSFMNSVQQTVTVFALSGVGPSNIVAWEAVVQ